MLPAARTGVYSSLPPNTREPITKEVLKSGRHLITMRGNETFRIAVRNLTEVSKRVLKEGKVEPSELTLFVPHQANRRIIDAVGERLGIDDDQVYLNVDRVGNTSSASIPSIRPAPGSGESRAT